MSFEILTRMPTIHEKQPRKLVLALEEIPFGGVVFDLHLVNDHDLHSVGNITMT